MIETLLLMNICILLFLLVYTYFSNKRIFKNADDNIIESKRLIQNTLKWCIKNG